MFNFFSELKNKYGDIKNKINPYQIVMMGDYLMYIEGKITLMTLSKENIVLKVSDGVIIVTGKDLQVKDLTKNTLSICGKVKSWEKVW